VILEINSAGQHVCISLHAFRLKTHTITPAIDHVKRLLRMYVFEKLLCNAFKHKKL